ncbi:PHD-type domain-containing protein [Heracleum sosnowskyi]|uniref:PHD-type domain-containing protein n=1 Tax=Heracleum sosnowskyi TaxID=360622 RepID=A0AAD8MY81_9APIA|nr:PHD-type domain-containing protein [Heracleum sosnowskyi]
MTVEKEKKLNGHAFRALFKQRARKTTRPVPDSVADLSVKVNVSPKKQRVDSSIRHAYLQNGENNHDDDVGAGKELPCCTKSKLYMDIESQYHKCANCMNGGTLLDCSGQGCKRRFHLSCVNPPLSYVPPGVWHCAWCTDRKIKFGLHSVSEGIESIWDVREVLSNNQDTQRQKEYLVKYKALAHVHNRWMPEAQVKSEAPVLFTKFMKKNQIRKNNIEWTLPDRLLDKRLILLPDNDSNVSDCPYEWLVKWKGLSYNQASWELENASFMRTPEAMKLINSFEIRHKKNSDRVLHSPEKSKLQGRQSTFTDLSKLPLQGSPDICNFNLTYVNKLRDCWHRGRHCLIIDDQERVVKVVLFILSFQRCLKHPFLIITAASDLPLWEAQFSRWASSENIVVYMGNKDIRSSIKALEFYNEGGCIMFQVLITPAQVFAEDLEVLEAIKWEVIIIDECQRRSVSDCLTQLKMLAVNMRLFTASHEIEDRRFNYQAMLSLLDPDFDQPAQQTEPNLEFCDLKERLAPFVAFKCKYGMPKFAEYWVPVHLSNVQIEQYCEALLSNTVTLCSNTKNDSVHSLRELLTLTRKCCDHPSLVDHSVQSFLATSLPESESDHLDIGVKISGKLQLLDKILTEAKKRSLKVLVMFQSLGGSGQIFSVGDILSDFVHQQFGQESYTRIDRDIIRLKMKSGPNIINMEDSGKFVCLIESRACSSRIKLSSLDMVILFGSDWNPRNDLRALEKITINSQFDQIKVLRLYTSFTVEEQILVLAKQGSTLDSNVMNMGRSTCHGLLNWGAYYLYNKLNIFHNCDLPVPKLNNESQQSLLDDILHELLAIFSRKIEYSDTVECSIISYVQQIEGAYKSKTMLFGEKEFMAMPNYTVIKQVMDGEPPHVLWSNLLEGREHKWKFLPEQSPRKRKKVKYSLDLPDEFATQVISSKTKCSREISKTGNRIDINTRLKINRKVPAPNKKTQLAGTENRIDLNTRLKNNRKISAPKKKTQLAGMLKHILGSTFKRSPRSTRHMRAVNHASKPSSTPLGSNSVSRKGNGGDEVTLGDHDMHDVNHARSPSSMTQEFGCAGEKLTLGEHVAQTGQYSDFTSRRGESPSDSLFPLQHQTIPYQSSSYPLHQQHCSPNPPIEVRGHPIVEELSRLLSAVHPAPTLPPQMSTNIFEYGNNNLQHPRTSEALQCTPLQMELEREKQCIEQAIKICEDMKMRLISDRDKEIAELHKKYNLLFQQAELTSKRHMHDLKTRYAKLCRTELLAKAFLQMNHPGYQDLSLVPPKEGHQCGQLVSVAIPVPEVDELRDRHMISNHMPQLGNMVNQTVIYPAAEMTIPRSEQSLIDPRMKSLPPVTPSVEAVILSSPVHCGTRNMPQIRTSAGHVTGLQANPAMQSGLYARSQFRNNAPAPHLRHSRPSYIPIPNLPSYPNLLPNTQFLGKQHLTPAQSGSLQEIFNQRVDGSTAELPELPQQLDSSNFFYPGF